MTNWCSMSNWFNGVSRFSRGKEEHDEMHVSTSILLTNIYSRESSCRSS